MNLLSLLLLGPPPPLRQLEPRHRVDRAVGARVALPSPTALRDAPAALAGLLSPREGTGLARPGGVGLWPLEGSPAEQLPAHQWRLQSALDPEWMRVRPRQGPCEDCTMSRQTPGSVGCGARWTRR